MIPKVLDRSFVLRPWFGASSNTSVFSHFWVWIARHLRHIYVWYRISGVTVTSWTVCETGKRNNYPVRLFLLINGLVLFGSRKQIPWLINLSSYYKLRKACCICILNILFMAISEAYVYNQIIWSLVFCWPLMIGTHLFWQANILINDDLHVCLTDFGLTTMTDASVVKSSPALSARWAAPELIDPDKFKTTHFPFPADIYAFACVCIEVSV